LRGGLTLAALAELPHVVVSALGVPIRSTDRALAERGLKRRIALIVPSVLALRYVLPGTDRIALLPERLARRVAQWGPLRTLPLPRDMPAINVSMLWHGRDEDDPAQQWLRRLTGEAIAGATDDA
jgi:DNA-binding transcriptional LysR family regulator